MATPDLKAAALGYAAAGWPVFPTRHDKTPYTPNGVLDATTDEARIEEWWDRWPGANIALACGEARLLVLDFDPGAADPAAVLGRVGAKPTKLVARTPRGGEHHYYLLDEGDPPVPSRVQPFAERVDTRSFHGYVLLPPSHTRDGDYEWVGRGAPARRSDTLLEACGRQRERDRANDWIVEPDLPENIELARAWLRGERAIGDSWCRPAIEGSGGDNNTYAAAAMMKSCGLSEEAALEALWEHYNPRCEPPWEYDDLARKVANGYSYNTSPPGNVTPAYHVAKVSGAFRPVESREIGGGREFSAGQFRVVDRAGIRAIQPPEWLVPGVLGVDSVAMLSGAPESFKTFVALDLALTVATGAPALTTGEWQGLWEAPAKTGPVLFIVGEGRAGIKQRVEAWEKHHLGGAEASSFTLADPVPHVHAGVTDQLIEAALRLHPDGYRLVVVDTVARAMQGVSESSSENATALTAMSDRLRQGLGATVLNLSHTGHEHKDRARGHSALLGDPDTLLVLNRHGNEYASRLTMTKQKEWEKWREPLWVRAEKVDLGGGRDSLVTLRGEAPAGAGRRDLEGRVTIAMVDRFLLDFLRQHPMQEFSTRELARRLEHHQMETDGGDKLTLGVSESTLRRDGPTGLKRLRAPDSGALCQPMYDAAKDKWRYSSPAASDFTPN